jgi:SAM-dependent methyltransferase
MCRSIETAKRFPQTTVIAFELSSATPPDIKPENCHLLARDSLQLHKLVNKFDVVHFRFVGYERTRSPLTMREVEKCLKPGGMVIWMIADQNLYHNWPPITCPPEKGARLRQQLGWLFSKFQLIPRIMHDLAFIDPVGREEFDALEEGIKACLSSHAILDPST